MGRIEVKEAKINLQSLFFVFLVGLFSTSGCTSCPVALDRHPYEPIINAELLTIEVVSVNNALISKTIIEDAVDYYRPYVSGQIKILDCDYVDIDLGADNAISRQKLDEVINLREHLGPTWITIVVCPDMDFFSRKGFYSGMMPKDKPEQIRHSIAINAKTCNKHASSIPFVSSEKLTSLVILHELCHALRVPARKEHVKKGNDGHCANTNCILYPTIDMYSAFSAILHLGPPTGLCKQCREEVLTARKIEAPSIEQ